MSGDETIQKREEDYTSDEDGDDELEQVPHVDVDVTKLNPLSPEVISKQVCISEACSLFCDTSTGLICLPLGNDKSWCEISLVPRSFHIERFD